MYESAHMYYSRLLYEGEMRYRGFENDEVESLLSSESYTWHHSTVQLHLRKILSSGPIPMYSVTEYKIPLHYPTDIHMLKAYLFVSMSQSNPRLFDKDTVIGDVVEAAWLQYGWLNHIIITAFYVMYLGVTTLLNYKFHNWIQTYPNSRLVFDSPHLISLLTILHGCRSFRISRL